MPEEVHKYINEDIKNLSKQIATLTNIVNDVKEEASGTRKAVEIQNGRVTKLEGRWEKMTYGLIVALLGIVLSLVVYIYITGQANQTESLKQALQGVEIKIVE